METILEPGVTKCALKCCGDTIKPEFGYVKAIDLVTGKEVFFCLRCHTEQAQIWRDEFSVPQQIPAN